MTTTPTTARTTLVDGSRIDLYWSTLLNEWVTVPERDNLTEAELLAAEMTT